MKIYAKYPYTTEMKVALERLADHIETIVVGEAVPAAAAAAAAA